MEDFLKFVAEIMEVSPSDIGLDTQYGAFEKWDSLMMLTLMMEIEERYGVSIPIEGLGRVKTLSDLYEYVK